MISAMSYERISARHFLLWLALPTMGFVVGTAWNGARNEARSSFAASPAPPNVSAELSEDERSTIEVFQETSPSVVYITSLAVRRDFRMNLLTIPQGTGSGFIWDDEGHIVTNFHVIQRADRAQVTLADHSTWDADVVGVAADKDLAVLRIGAPANALPPIVRGVSADLLVGQKVLAIGNPFGLDQSLSTGIISALGREIESVARVPIRNVIQTDAAINPGNSGGPLLDSAGRLIGVNTAIFSPSGASAGVGFAIPFDTVEWVVDDLIEYGELRRPTIGVELVSDAWVRRYRLEGALILDVVPGTGAAEAGLRSTRRDRRGRITLGDLIVAVDGEPIGSAQDLLLRLEEFQIGDTVQLTISRDRHEKNVEIRLGAPGQLR